MNDCDINDRRQHKEFTGKTFSSYKKNDAKKQLISSITNNKIEQACYWSAEFICAGHFLDLWEYIIEYIGKSINVSNVKLAIYLDKRVTKFIDILKMGYLDNELNMRNNQQVRELFAEIICLLCQSKKRPKFEKNKIKISEFNMLEMKYRIKAPDDILSKSILKKGDSQELTIPINEFLYNISKSVSHFQHACYWIDWILEYENIAKKKKEKISANRRAFVPVDEKLQMDMIWIVWECILTESNNRSKTISTINNSLLSLFCLRFSPSTKNKRRYLIYYAVSLLTEPFNVSIQLSTNLEEASQICKNINIIYKQIKKKEIQPDTQYLFSSLGEKSKEENLKVLNEKLDIFANAQIPPRFT